MGVKTFGRSNTRVTKLLGYEDVLSSLAEVDAFFKNLDSHKATKY